MNRFNEKRVKRALDLLARQKREDATAWAREQEKSVNRYDKKRIWDMIEGTRAPNKDAWLLERIAEIKKKAGPKCVVPTLSSARANRGAPYSADGLRYCHASYPNREWYADCPYCGRHAYVD